VNRFRKTISSLDANPVLVLMLFLLPLIIVLTFTLIKQQSTAVLLALVLAGIQWGIFVTTQRRLVQKLAQSQYLQTEHTQTQIALHNSETKLSAIFKMALDGIVQLDGDTIIAANPAFAAMLGYPVAEIVGQPIAQYIIPRDHNLIADAMATRTRGEAIATIYEISLVRRDNSEYPIEITIGTIQYTEQITILAIVRGMSIRKQAAQNIRQLNTELQQQASHLTVLNQIGQAVSTLTDLKSVLRNALEQFKSIMSLDVFFVILHDTDEPMKGFPIMYDSGQFWDSDILILPLDPNSLTGMVVRTGEPLLINRTAEEIDQPGDSMIGDRNQVSASLMMAPLKVGERIIGAISIQSYTLNAYDERHRSLLMGAAYHIAIAVENARLYEALQKELVERKQAAENIRQLNSELQQQAAHLGVLNQIGQAVSTLTDLKSVLHKTLAQFQTIMPLDVFFVILPDAEKPMISFPVMYDGGKFWNMDAITLPLDDNAFTQTVIRTGEPLLVNRTATELNTPQNPGTMVGDTKKISASILMAPLKVGERIIGAISIQSYTLNAYDERHRLLLMGAAYHIAVAVENARLYEELQKELAERKHAEEMVRQLNAELEQRVIQRTEQLQAANQELEAFSYSVSHDLRAPLRALHGFANILSEDLGDTVSADVQHYLNRIQYNARRMGDLIDDLLALSRVGRAELRMTTVNMNLLVQQVLTEMRNDNSLNGTTVIVEDLPPCRGDNGLLKLVWVNLIENAVKYSHKREHPHIEIRTKPEANQCFYMIEDNGTGFDMQYLDKLFGVFQRLHPADAYEGTGIGLATVKRIITRHGGEIRAEAERDKGATFYFSIGNMDSGH
jgi:PAS domain S-box-containing protein